VAARPDQSRLAVCRLQRQRLEAGRREAALLPTRMKLLLTLAKGEVEVGDVAAYEQLLRGSPHVAYNPRWDFRRAWFEGLELGPSGTVVTGRAKDVDDVAELMRRMSLAPGHHWLLESASRDKPGPVTFSLRLVQSSPSAGAKHPVGKCPHGVKAPAPPPVPASAVIWRPLPEARTPLWIRTGLSWRTRGGLKELTDLFLASPTRPAGFTGASASFKGGEAELTLLWHEVRQDLDAAASREALRRWRPPRLKGKLLPGRGASTTMPHGLDRVGQPKKLSDTRWALSGIKGLEAWERQPLVELKGHLERTRVMRRRYEAWRSLRGHRKVLAQAHKCLTSVLSTRSASSRVEHRVDGDGSVRFIVRLPPGAKRFKIEELTRPGGACLVLKEPLVSNRARPKDPTLEMDVQAQISRPPGDDERLGRLRLSAMTQKFRPRDRTQMLTLQLRSYCHRVEELLRYLEQGLPWRLAYPVALAELYAQTELAGLKIASLRLLPGVARVSTARLRALDLVLEGDLKEALEFLRHSLKLRELVFPARWTWRARGKSGRLELRLYLAHGQRGGKGKD